MSKKIKISKRLKESAEQPLIEQPTNEDSDRIPPFWKKKSWNIWHLSTVAFGISTVIFACLFFFTNTDNQSVRVAHAPIIEAMPSSNNDTAENLIAVDVLSQSVTLYDFLKENGIPTRDVEFLEESASQKFWTTLETGDKIKYFYKYTKNDDNLHAIIYEPKDQPELYYKMVVKDSLWVARYTKKVEIKTQVASVIIEESLIEAILDNGLRYDLIEYMEKALAWSVDFYNVQPGDRFKVIYDEKFIGGQSKEIVELKAIHFQQKDEEYQGYLFKINDEPLFFDQQGSELKKAFLKSPLKYGRLTSGFSLERIHPVTGELKGHFGTDYAAPEGTPILAVGSGRVTKAEFKTNNGNYVKIQHDLPQYETQYLHMSQFAPNIKPGVRVKQGEVIGFVGSTGLATGPHVCFRFWKNKKQVDHRKENVAAIQILPSQYQVVFEKKRDSLRHQLQNLWY